jgi:hypothetical protein
MLRRKRRAPDPRDGLTTRADWPNSTWLPRAPRPGEYALDLDGSERFSRFIDMRAPVVTPDLPGAVGGLLPLFDIRSMVYAAYAKAGFGPGTTQYPVNLQWQVNIEGLDKRSVPQ